MNAFKPDGADRHWWRTSIVDISPGAIRVRGYPIEDLIGAVGFVDMIWLMLRGELPKAEESRLLEAVLVAAVDHGPQAPSIAIARMSMTCGIGINNAMASGVNALGDVHGGAGQQCMALYAAIATHIDAGLICRRAVEAELDARIDPNKHVPGFGHRFHPTDPRAGRLLTLSERALASNAAAVRFVEIGRAVESVLSERKGKRIPMNIDGATAVALAGLGFSPEQGRGLFVLSRSVGILAHACEQFHQGGRIKGPMPPSTPYLYEGPSPRRMSDQHSTVGAGEVST